MSQDTITIPTTPPRALLVSMAMRMRHDFGFDKPEGESLCSGMTPREREVLLDDMERLYEEIAGKGFYKWDGSRDEMYQI